MQWDTRMSLSMTISFLGTFPSVQSCQVRKLDHADDLCQISSVPGLERWLGCFDIASHHNRNDLAHLSMQCSIQ